VPTFSSATYGRYTGAWLIGTAVFELLLAAGFFFLGIAKGISGMTLTGSILGIVGIGLLLFGIASRKKAAEAERIDETGLAGSAQIVGMTQTGMYLNNNPQIGLQLLVNVPGRNPYQTEVRQFVPLMLLGSLAPGGTLPVKVDQQDPSKVVIDWDGGVQPNAAWQGAWGAAGGALPGALPGAMPGMGGAAMVVPGAPMMTSAVSVAGQNVDAMRSQLASTGLDGIATIGMAQDSGVAVGNNRVFTVQMTVNVPGRAPYQEMSAAMVPIEDAAKIVAGATVPVKVSPDNPNLVMIQWDRI
jgi:hypothetical protein